MREFRSADAAPLLGELGQVLHAFFHALDQRRYEAVLALFTEDARWLRQGKWLEGKPAVRAALDARPLDTETRHVLSNTYVTAIDGGSVEVETYMTAYRYSAPAAPDFALPTVAHPLRFNQTTTVFRRDPGHDWRITEQRLVATFGFAE